MRRKVIVVGVMGCLVALIAAGVSMGQPQGQRGQRGMFDPAQMRQMMEQRMKEQLGITDAEWQVIGPRLTKVMTLSRQTQMGGGMARMFMRGRRGQGGPMGGPQGGPPEGAPQGGGRRGQRGGPFGQEETAVSKASDALQTTLENAEATPEQIKAGMTALRNAKEKARQELATAQKELREVLSLRQEAQMVLMGMLN
jgi:hypothetical protein